ncbi:MAG: acyl-CoA reductase [Gemmatimonadota bacterium]|nr:acyl-CoA reductase [Gemmatimonadota bacterium]
MSGAFDAWALPHRVDAPTRSSLSLVGGSSQLRYLDSDPDWLAQLLDALADARVGLLDRRAGDLCAVLGSVGARLLDPHDALRKRALEHLPADSGLSPEMAAVVLDGMARDWTEDRLRALLVSEFRDVAYLDGFVERDGRSSMAVGPRLCFQVVAGSVPGVGVSALIRSLLLKSPTLLKPGRGDCVLPVLFASALGEEDPELAAALAVVYWPGGSEVLEGVALQRADTVVAYGGDESVAALRNRVPVTKRFVAYHHRFSVAVVGVEALGEPQAEACAADLANAVAIFDQRGCVSPRVVYAEQGGAVSPRALARLLARSLADLEHTLPSGALDGAEASALHQVRGTAELLAASDSGAEVHHGGGASWTVIFDPGLTVLEPCLGRMVQVVPLADVAQLPDILAGSGVHLQTVGIAGLGDREKGLALRLGHAGVSRVVPLAEVPFPPPWWHHDGGSPLGDLIRWVDLGDG